MKMIVVSILGATLWKVVVRCKIVMFFNPFGPFSENANCRGSKILSPQVPNI